MGHNGLLRRELYFLICRYRSYLTGDTLVGHHGLLGGWLSFLYVGDIRTPQEAHLRAPRPVTGIALLFPVLNRLF
jgi:hypothetical protein